MKFAIIIFSYLFFIYQTLAQTTYTTVSSGDWTTSGTWSGGNIPQNNISDGSVVDVDHVITSGNLTIGSSGTANININANTTLTSISFNGSGTLNVIVANGVTFSAGSISNDNNITTNITGDISTTGDLRINSGSFTVSGNLTVGGSLEIFNNATLNLNKANISSNLNLHNGIINISGRVDVGGNADLNNSGSLVNISDNGALVVNGLLDMDNVDILGTGVVSWGTINMNNDANFEGLGARVVPPFNPYDLDGGAGTLPVTLIDFTAILTSSQIILNWSTASEINFDYFSIQKSSNGTSYKEIARVKGHGFSKVVRQYEYIDGNPGSGISYYRLQTFDFDGTTEIFKPISVLNEQESGLMVYPNPVVGNALYIWSNEVPNNNLNFSIYNKLGKLLCQDQLSSSSHIVDLSGYPRGIYFIRFSEGREIKIIKK